MASLPLFAEQLEYPNCLSMWLNATILNGSSSTIKILGHSQS